MKQGWIQVNNNNAQEPLAPKTMADMVYMDETQSQSVKDAILYHTPIHMTAALPAGKSEFEAAGIESAPCETIDCLRVAHAAASLELPD